VSSLPIDPRLAARLYAAAGAERWQVPAATWTAALEASAHRAFEGRTPAARDIEQYLESLHLEDLAVACGCQAGSGAAWDQFVREHRPGLYRAADALDPAGGREIADSLYGDLYGLGNRQAPAPRSLFRYFHGRSSLATWLRAVLAQRHVDRLRRERRLAALPDDESSAALPSPSVARTPDWLRFVALLQRALDAALGRLAPRDRLRIACYYAQGLTLAEVGRVLGEHEATVSRHLARTRRGLRQDIEAQLSAEGLSDDEMAECFESVAEDPGPIDLERLLVGASRKEPEPNRSDQ
jgi:RNA polymerase sigma factor (sigma-70 family)